MERIEFLKDDDVLAYYLNKQINSIGFIMPKGQKVIEVKITEQKTTK